MPVGEKSSSHTIPLFKQKEKGQKEKIVYIPFENKFLNYYVLFYLRVVTYCCKFTKQ